MKSILMKASYLSLVMFIRAGCEYSSDSVAVWSIERKCFDYI